jgi:hypothetical protein
MIRRIPPLFRFPIAVLALATGAVAESKDVSPEELPAAIEWFNQLTVPDVAGKSYVEVVEQRYAQTGGKPYERKRRGFLLAEDETTWTLAPDGTSAGGARWLMPRGMEKLWPMRIAKPKAEALPGASPVMRVMDLRQVAAEIIAEIEVKPPRDQDSRWDRSGKAGGCTAVFVLARFCERNGLADAARDLDRALLSLPLETPRQPDAAVPGRDRIFSLRENLERELGWVLLRATLTACADLRVPRTELLLRFERLGKEYAGIAEIERVRGHEATLRRMIAEDARPARDVDALAPEEQAREWIFRLRDQTEQMHGGSASGAKVSVLEPGPYGPGMPDFSHDDRRPAQQLLNLGHAAVPALIEALSDTRFARTIQTYNMQPSLPTVVTVAVCAEAILERISGRSFWWERVSVKQDSRTSTPADIRPTVEKWWRDLNERGESAVEADGIRQGGQSSMELARRLIDRDAVAATRALPEGIAHAETPWIRESLVELLGRIPAAEARPFLREEMARGRWLNSRVAAARMLYREDHEEAFAAMVGEWRRWEPAPEGRRDAGRETPESLVRFLITAHRVDGIRALASRFAGLSIETKVLVLEAFARACDGARWRWAVQPPWAPGEQPSLRDATSAAEDFLFQALDDTAVNPHMSYGGGDQPSWQARVCDHAAVALLSLRTGKWSGPGEATAAARDARIAALKSGGRQERGPSSVPAPIEIRK